MPMIKGIDDAGKEMWLQESGYWGESQHAKNFTPAQADYWLNQIITRNRYIPHEDRVTPTLVKERH